MRGRQERKERRSFREPVALKVGDDDFTVSGDVDQNTDASQGTMRQLSAATIDDWTT